MTELLPATISPDDRLLDGDEAARLLAHGSPGVPTIVDWEGHVLSSSVPEDDADNYLRKTCAAHEQILSALRTGQIRGLVYPSGTRDLRELPIEYWFLPGSDNVALRFANGGIATQTKVYFATSAVKKLAGHEEPTPTRTAKQKGGAPGTWNWIELVGALIRHADLNDLSDMQSVSAWAKWGQDWLDAKYDNHPSDSRIREVLTPYFNAYISSID
jgi:hypothetical protein